MFTCLENLKSDCDPEGFIKIKKCNAINIEDEYLIEPSIHHRLLEDALKKESEIRFTRKSLRSR